MLWALLWWWKGCSVPATMSAPITLISSLVSQVAFFLWLKDLPSVSPAELQVISHLSTFAKLPGLIRRQWIFGWKKEVPFKDRRIIFFSFSFFNWKGGQGLEWIAWSLWSLVEINWQALVLDNSVTADSEQRNWIRLSEEVPSSLNHSVTSCLFLCLDAFLFIFCSLWA